jgi:glucan biosynthesis protein C
VPFVTALFTLNIVQLYVLNVYNAGQPAGLAYLVSPALWSDFSSDRWISHLWFLICLAYYVAALACGAAVLDRGGRRATLAAAASQATAIVGHPVACLLLLPLANLAILTAFSVAPVLYSLRPIVSLEDVARYIPYFAAGLLAFTNRRFYESLTRFTWSMVALTAAVVAVLLGGPTRGDFDGARVIAAYIGFAWSWVAIYWVLVVFRTILDRPSRVASTLADSAYSIYLFHHLTVILIAWWLLHVEANVFVKFGVVVTTTFVATLALHLLIIRRLPWLTFLFNGKPRAMAWTGRPSGRPTID